MSERFYVEHLEETGRISIEGPEARHIARVMRLEVGDELTLFDGRGHECRATIDVIGKNSVSVQVNTVVGISREPTVSIVAAVALPKGDRLKFMIEKLTELGVARVVPLECQRSSVRPRENTLEKMRRHVIEASKQCGRNQLMQIRAPASIDQLVQMAPDSSGRFICLPESEPSPSSTSLTDHASDEVWIVVGPEGGFTSQELASASHAGWRSVNLGSRILRTETAIIAACVLAAGQTGH